MIRRLALVILVVLLPQMALAQAVRVTSGDHSDFTRIVVEYPQAVDWQFGRTADGYELRVPGDALQYDLTKAFDLIKKDRIAAVWADPDTGALHVSVACACFAMPFEFRPGTVVIDIRNGEPPKGSAFEESLDGDEVASLEPPPAPKPQERPDLGPKPVYDWTSWAMNPLDVQDALQGSSLSLSQMSGARVHVDLEPLRESLIQQLSRGASAGIVDMAKPKPSKEAPPESEGNPSVELYVGESPNLETRQKGEAEQPMTAEGDKCFSDEQLDIATWSVKPPEAAVAAEGHGGEAPKAEGEATPKEEGKKNEGKPSELMAETPAGIPLEEETPIPEQFAIAMANLTGEFDKPDPEAIQRAVRFDLHIGFGAEARALMRAFPVEEEDAPIWQSMARIIDEEKDPNPVFTGMETCDTSAALWAILADPSVLSIGQVQKSAILRGFSALPPHLRDHLGPTLVDRFLAMEDFATATALRDAVVRGNPESGPEVELMQAGIDKASGSPGESVKRLEELTAASGPTTADALVALVTQRAELGQEVTYDQVTAMEEYAKEREGSEDHEKFQTALTLAYAASGDFPHAFENLAKGPDAAKTLWTLLGNAGTDTDLLNYATLEEGAKPPRPSIFAATLIADRMLQLGFSDQAERWLAEVDSPPPLLAARIAVEQGQAQKALDLLGEQETPAAIQVRLNALTQMGDEVGVAALFDELGMTQEHWNAISRMKDWAKLANEGPDVWKAAAAALIPPEAAPVPFDPTAPPSGPLAQSRALIDQSQSTRDAISALLNSVKSPVAPSQ